MDTSKYIEIFIEESQEHLHNLNKNLLSLEKNPPDKKTIDEIFRTAHTIKGMAGTMGFLKVSSITHEMESLLQDVREGQLLINNNLVDLLFEAFDFLEKLISVISATQGEGSIEIIEIINKLKNYSEKLMESSIIETAAAIHSQNNYHFNELENSLVLEASLKGYLTLKIEINLAHDCLLKSARSFIVFKSIEKYGEIIKTIPSVQDIEDEKFDTQLIFYIITKNEPEIIERDLLSISEVTAVNLYSIKVESTGIIKSDEILVSEEEQVNPASSLDRGKKLKTGKTVRVDIDRLDNLMNLVSELIIIKTRMEGLDNSTNITGLNEAVEYLERITTNLHDAVMKVRMVPIEQVFNRFPRMVRDVSRELGKEIELMMEGAETELDRTVIDEIGDPLIHLIRNSIDHGIEHPDKRISLGKNPSGLVKLNAFQDGNNVVIEVIDDGKGIDMQKVKSKGIELGLINSEIDLNQGEIINLMFKPGFSTADRISDLSGRGVGLDVVKTKIEALGGTIEVRTKRNSGSVFIVRLPLTLAIIQALMVMVANENYAIPLNGIKETITVDVNQIKEVRGQEVILFRGSILPLIRLSKVVESESFSKGDLTIVIVKKGDKSLGIVVDELIGQQEIVIKPIGKLLMNIKLIAGATILGDGKVALIIDINSLV
jgi:two-component system chemotaxis sensor kinase CheA